MPRPTKDNTIGRKIRQRRIQLGLSQERLGERMGISYQQVQKYEKGLSNLTVWRFQQIARILHVPTDFFLEDISVAREVSPPYGAFSNEEKRLLKEFRMISKPSVRKAFLRLIQAVSERGDK